MKKRTAAFVALVLSVTASTDGIAQRTESPRTTATTSREPSPDRGGVLRTPEPTKGMVVRAAEISKTDLVNTPRTGPARPDLSCAIKAYYWYITCCGGPMGIQNVRHWNEIPHGSTFDFSGGNLGDSREFQLELWIYNIGNRGGANPASSVWLSRNGKPKEWTVDPAEIGSWSGQYPFKPGEATLIRVFALSNVVWGYFPPDKLQPGLNKIDALAKVAAIPDEDNQANNTCSVSFTIDWKK